MFGERWRGDRQGLGGVSGSHVPLLGTSSAGSDRLGGYCLCQAVAHFGWFGPCYGIANGQPDSRTSYSDVGRYVAYRGTPEMFMKTSYSQGTVSLTPW